MGTNEENIIENFCFIYGGAGAGPFNRLPLRRRPKSTGSATLIVPNHSLEFPVFITGGCYVYFTVLKLPTVFYLIWKKKKFQCCGSASIIMRVRIQDPKNVHMDPDPRG